MEVLQIPREQVNLSCLKESMRSGANKLSQKYYSNLNKNLNVQIENPQSEVFFLKMEHN